MFQELLSNPPFHEKRRSLAIYFLILLLLLVRCGAFGLIGIVECFVVSSSLSLGYD